MAPLAGVRVIELSTMITGPLAGMLLADLGAAVIKVETPQGGDPFRSFRGGRYGGHFIAYNRNKQSLTLDLRQPRGRDILAACGQLAARGGLNLVEPVSDLAVPKVKSLAT